MGLSFQVVRGVKDDRPFSENDATTVLCIYVSASYD